MKPKATKRGGTMKDARNKYRILAVSAIAVLMLCLTAGLSSAGTVELPQTGQTTSYETGDDGDLEKGAAWPSPRFTDNSNGTITDNLTGLVWLKDANCLDTVGGVNKSGGTLTWQDALTWSNNLANGSCGLTDGSTAGQWRLPNVNELESLVHAEQANTATWLNTQGFSNVQSNWYWSSTTNAYVTDLAWVVNMWNGNVLYGPKDSNYYVWPVRSGSGGSLYNLAISKGGTGTGTVTSSPAGIDCGADCSESYNEGTSVTLTATADPGSTFAGWSGDADCSDGSVTMNANKTCTATFNVTQFSSWYGGAVITSTQNVVAVARPHIGTEVTTYSGFTGGSTTAYVPMLFKNKWGYDSALYIQNLGGSTANVTIDFYDTNGTLSCTKTDTIPSMASHGYWLPSMTCD